MSARAEAIDQILAVEGGYVNDPADSGGETNYGITEEVARLSGYRGAMRDMTRDQAADIYASLYWEPIRGDELANLSKAIALEVFDTGVNCGLAVAVMFLQRSLNVLNQGGKDYPDLKVDGRIGPVTVNALDVYLRKRGMSGQKVLLRMLNALQGARYVELAEKRAKDERFIFGWFLHRVVI